jgi:hypothetical protein
MTLKFSPSKMITSWAICLTCSITSASFAQVGINTALPKATLDVTASSTTGNKPEGVIAPRLTGNQLVSANNMYLPAQTGVIVYVTSIPTTSTAKTVNVTAPGYYYFDGTVWNGMGALSTTTTLSVSSIIDPNILGYVPSTTNNATTNAPASFIINNITCSKVGITTFNGHSYAAYSTSANGLTWYEAYNKAKELGGYLATFTTDDEWKHIETTLLTPNSIFDTQHAWIGFAKFSWFAGVALTPDPEEKWITGEQPLHDYSAGGLTAVRKSNWFLTGEPNNSGGVEGFVHTYSKNSGVSRTYSGYTSTHPWNDVAANAANRYGFIVEFQQ